MPAMEAPERLRTLQDFVNTLDRLQGTDELTDEKALSAWLAERGLLATAEAGAGPADHARAIELRESLRRMALANNGHPASGEAAALVERLAREAELEARFPAAGGWRLEPRARGVAGALGRLISILVEGMADGSWSRLKGCSSDSCQWVFYDASKNHSGHWCSMRTCGNRAKARQFRARRRSAATPGRA
jgi:predicted RNA-binding Zn ribbon-like protein